MDPIRLTYGVDGRRAALLREPRGSDELATRGATYRDATRLIASLLEQGADLLGAGDIERLPVCDFDRLASGLYRMLYGQSAEVRCTCPSCRKAFEFTIPLASLETVPEVPANGVGLVLSGGTHLRLPSVGDVLRQIAPSANIPFVTVAGNDPPAEIEARLASLCPVSAQAIAFACPHCTAESEIAFDLVIFLMKMFARESDFLLREIHLVARVYGWSLNEILSLPRTVRHGFVKLVAAKPPDRRRVAA